MPNYDDLIGYEEHFRDESSDYTREAFGDPCPACGSPRYGGDCSCDESMFDTLEERRGER